MKTQDPINGFEITDVDKHGYLTLKALNYFRYLLEPTKHMKILITSLFVFFWNLHWGQDSVVTFALLNKTDSLPIVIGGMSASNAKIWLEMDQINLDGVIENSEIDSEILGFMPRNSELLGQEISQILFLSDEQSSYLLNKLPYQFVVIVYGYHPRVPFEEIQKKYAAYFWPMGCVYDSTYDDLMKVSRKYLELRNGVGWYQKMMKEDETKLMELKWICLKALKPLLFC